MAIYLDNAAATPVDSDVLAAMLPYFSQQFHNPSALYGPAVEAGRALERARSDIAGLLGSKSSEVIFTAGGTEANNLALHGVMQKHPKANLAISAIEHDSVRVPAKQYQTKIIPVNDQGITTPEEAVKAVDDMTVLVSVMYANNEVGTVQPIRRIAADLVKIRAERQKKANPLPLYLHTDAAQAGNYLDLHAHRLGIDLMTINGGKLYGPKQSGALYVRSGVDLKAQITGGGQERTLRSGTENLAGAAGLAAALEKAVALRHEESRRVGKLRDGFIQELQAALTDVIINGSLKHRLPNNLHITLPGTDSERVLFALDMAGIYAASGSACSATSEESSHVLAAMGISDEMARASIRFSLGRQTTAKDLSKTVEVLRRILA